MEIPIGEMMCKLRVDETRQRDKQHVAEVVYRWLKRGARRVGGGTNRPSLRLQTEREPDLRKTYLYGSVSTFPNTAPDWLENRNVTGLHSVPLIDG